MGVKEEQRKLFFKFIKSRKPVPLNIRAGTILLKVILLHHWLKFY